VEIENNDEWNFKDLRGMRRNAKSLKRKMRACKGILIAPSKLPRFSSGVEILRPNYRYELPSNNCRLRGPRIAARMASRLVPIEYLPTRRGLHL